MADLKSVKRTKAIKITLSDGVKRELKFTLNALAEMEDKYGSVEKAFKILESNSIKAVRFILWCGLLHEDDELTEKQVGNLIDIKNMQEMMESLGNAMDTDMPDAEEVIEDPKKIAEIEAVNKVLKIPVETEASKG